MEPGPYFGDHGAMTDAEREERYLQDRTCLACGDASGFSHACPEPSASECQGHAACDAALHEHGCYADLGKCDHPEEHVSEPTDSGRGDGR